jgi:DNA-binding CsgD family transcriptional regulator
MPYIIDRSRADEARLTPRESEILLLFVEGLSSKEMGRRLAISPYTVRVHLSSLRQKLASNRALGLAALERGILTPNKPHRVSISRPKQSFKRN